MNQRLFVGFGSPHGDDQIGWRVAEALAPLQSECRQVRKAASPPDLFDWLEGVDRLTLCDACRGAVSPGTLFRWRWPEIPTSRLRNSGSHDLGLIGVLHLAGRLGRLPASVEIVGIEIQQSAPGTPMSAAVTDALSRVVATLRSEWNHA